jgi:hypothetical protein
MEQLMRHDRTNAFADRWIREASIVVLGDGKSDAMRSGTSIGPGIAICGIQVAEVDIDTTIAAERPVAHGPAKPERRIVFKRSLGLARDFGDEVGNAVQVHIMGRHGIGAHHRVMNERGTAAHPEQRLAGERRTVRLRRTRGERDPGEGDLCNATRSRGSCARAPGRRLGTLRWRREGRVGRPPHCAGNCFHSTP